MVGHVEKPDHASLIRANLLRGKVPGWSACRHRKGRHQPKRDGRSRDVIRRKPLKPRIIGMVRGRGGPGIGAQDADIGLGRRGCARLHKHYPVIRQDGAAAADDIQFQDILGRVEVGDQHIAAHLDPVGARAGGDRLRRNQFAQDGRIAQPDGIGPDGPDQIIARPAIQNLAIVQPDQGIVAVPATDRIGAAQRICGRPPKSVPDP